MEKEYFDNKTDKMLDIMGLMILHMRDKDMVEKHKNDIKLILKEIAKDQRHACAEAVLKFGYIDDEIISNIHMSIINTHIHKEG